MSLIKNELRDSLSKNIKLAERGYNADHAYIDQIGVIMAFSSITKLPVGVDVFYGSMKDITTVRDFIERFPKKDIFLSLIGDSHRMDC